MIRTLCIAALLLARVPAALDAQDAPPACGDARTQSDMTQCAAMAYARADTALNQAYRQVLQGMEPAKKETLREAQRAWIRLRDADCELENAEFEGGSIHPMLFALCQAHQTRLRTGQLRELLAGGAEDGGSDHGAILRATDALFQAMQAKDTTALRTLMHPRAQIVSVVPTGVAVRTADEWIAGLSRNTDELIERMWDPQVQVDGDLATLWAPYDFHLGERFSHCGMDAFQFVREGGAWKMITVTFTRRTGGCQGPP
ncbi:MAG TPA: lysozyme inhibitor LprI family protein [Longimicrobium sp.]